MSKSINVQLRISEEWLALLRDIMVETLGVYPDKSRQGHDSHSDIIKTNLQLYLNMNHKSPGVAAPSIDSLNAVRSTQKGWRPAGQTPQERARETMIKPKATVQGEPLEEQTQPSVLDQPSEALRKLSAGDLNDLIKRLKDVLVQEEVTLPELLRHSDKKIRVRAAPLALYDFSETLSPEDHELAQKIFSIFWQDSDGSITPNSELPDRWNALNNDKLINQLWSQHFLD